MIGCHMSWGTAREDIKLLFHKSYSAEKGKLLPPKLLLALNTLLQPRCRTGYMSALPVSARAPGADLPR